MRFTFRIQQGRAALIAAFLLSTLVASLAPTGVFAQTSGIGGKPANPDASNARTKTIFVKKIAPGASVSDAVAVTNSGSEAKTVMVYATDSVPSSGGAFACAQAVEMPKQAGKWIALSQTAVSIPAGATVTVPFSITVPQEAEPGESNGCIVLQEKKEATVEGGISLNFRTAIRVAILVDGDIRKEVSTVGVDVSSKGSNVTVSPVVKNTGNVSVDVAVTGQLKTLFGTVIREHSDTFPLLRDQVTSWNIELPKPFWGGFVLATYALSYDKSSNYIGTTNSDTDITKVEGPSRMYFVPPSLLALCVELFVAILVIGMLVRFVIVRSHRRSVTHDWKDYKVKSGEQLQKIATRYGISWRLLARSNGLKAPYNLTAGQSIKVPHRQKTKKKQPPHEGPKE